MDKNEITEASTFSETVFYFYKYSLQSQSYYRENGEQLPSSPAGKYLQGKKKKNKTHAFHGEECIFFVSFRFSLDY